jgi:hypothetical protein
MIIKYKMDNIRIPVDNDIVDNIRLEGNNIEVEVDDNELDKKFTDSNKVYNFIMKDLVVQIADAIKSVNFKNQIHYEDVQ